MDKEGQAKRIAQKSRQVAESDDLLKGFDETGPTQGQYKSFFASSIAGSLWAWNVFFNYGLYGNLSTVANFKNTHHIVVISLVLLLGSLIVRREIRIRKWTLVAFAPAILLVLLRLIAALRS